MISSWENREVIYAQGQLNVVCVCAQVNRSVYNVSFMAFLKKKEKIPKPNSSSGNKMWANKVN